MYGWTTTSGSISTPASIQVDGRVDDRDAGQHVRLVDPVAEGGCGERELGARVHALGLERIACELHGAGLAVGHEQAERVGHVQLALSVVRVEALESRPQLVGAEDVDAGVDLAQRELLGRGVARLHDLGELALAVADDPPVGAGVGRLEGEDGRGGAGRRGASRRAR